MKRKHRKKNKGRKARKIRKENDQMIKRLNREKKPNASESEKNQKLAKLAGLDLPSASGNPIKYLFQLSMQHGLEWPEFIQKSETGPALEKTFTIECKFRGHSCVSFIHKFFTFFYVVKITNNLIITINDFF